MIIYRYRLPRVTVCSLSVQIKKKSIVINSLIPGRHEPRELVCFVQRISLAVIIVL